MEEQQLLDRITFNPKVMVGKPVIKGTRLTVEYILGLLAHGTTTAEICRSITGLLRKTYRHACCLPPNPWKTQHLCHWLLRLHR